MNPIDYEQAVKDLLAGMFAIRDGNSQVKIHHGRKFIGKRSGHAHEIDVSFELDVAGTQLLVLVECKAYRRRVGIDEVMEFASRLDDIAAHKGIFVTTKGFQKGAIKFAASKGIALVVASIGQWSVAHRLYDLPTARYSSKYFNLQSVKVQRDEGSVRLKFHPIDEVGFSGAFPMDETLVMVCKKSLEKGHFTPVIVEICASGGSSASNGEIILSSASG